MAFMTVSTGGGDNGPAEDRLPVLSYNAKAGRMFTLDREQDSGGNWVTNKIDVTMKQPAFAVDMGRLSVGWLFFAAGAAPMMALAPYGQPLPAKPAAPGPLDDKGRPQQFKQGFKVPVVGKDIGGVRELAGNSAAAIEGLNQLHTAYEAAPEAAAGQIPLVKMVNVIGIKSGQGENFMPVYEIARWVDRPDVLGPRTVPVPTLGARTSAPTAPTTNHVPPPAPKVAEKVRELEDAMPDF